MFAKRITHDGQRLAMIRTSSKLHQQYDPREQYESLGKESRAVVNPLSVVAPYFISELASTNHRGNSGVSINLLDGGAATPLMMSISGK